MSQQAETRAFLPVKIALITVSDSRTLKDDKSGRLLEEMITADGHQVVGREVLPLDTTLGRRDYEVWVVEAVLSHVTFSDPFFKAFLGEDPQLRSRVYLTVDRGVILRYSTPFFRITPSKSFGFSDFIVQR